MCGFNQNDTQVLGMAFGIITQLMQLAQSQATAPGGNDLLQNAVLSYQQGKITKAQLIAVIHALDESPSSEFWAIVQQLPTVK